MRLVLLPKGTVVDTAKNVSDVNNSVLAASTLRKGKSVAEVGNASGDTALSGLGGNDAGSAGVMGRCGIGWAVGWCGTASFECCEVWSAGVDTRFQGCFGWFSASLAAC
ncbi:hypothetical protein OIU78_025013 [Salix suchowensis]|nr:hypothetical protein OIU78_025013 [Salix suchowensis]